ncbi:MAG: arginine deiminase [Lachnospiraceae bacterium]|nr:arginine deiminase [Lachnospiraceae bacterium]MBR0093160.1 arginine deiminase [Lachnospiraceae bacterium]
MQIHVTSEIKKLKKVLLHRPDAELERLVPRELERLLFDDIPYLKTAQAEHDTFAEILRKEGVEVVYLEDLVAEVLADADLRKGFVRQFVGEGGAAALKFREQLTEYLLSIRDPKELVLKTMAGVSVRELKGMIHSPLVDLLQSDSRFLLDPIPNLYFTRDPFATIGNGVGIHHMYSATRQRETIYGAYVFGHHPDYANTPQYYHRGNPYSIEGGDILNLDEKTIAVGISQRTTPEAIELLATNLFADKTSSVEKILALYIPGVRAFMHLDTVFTQVDVNKFTVHPGILGSLRVFRITGGKAAHSLRVKELEGKPERILEKELSIDKVTLIKCGGTDRIVSEREQWNDGSNTLCVKPGTVIVYDRNDVTNEILRENGIRVLTMPSSELSRGRGGPRCMSMPLVRA